MFEQHRSPRTSSYQDTFLPNLAYLRGLLAGAKNEPRRGEPAGLTPLGRLLRRQPSTMAQLLSRTPKLVLELDRWVCGELRVARPDLAAAALKDPNVLRILVDRGCSVVAFFEEKASLQRQEVVRLLLRRPSLFIRTPVALKEKVRNVGDILGIDHSRAGQLMVSMPSLFSSTLNELTAVLSELDTLFGREGAGIDLVMQDPFVAQVSVSGLRRSLSGLLKLGFNEGEVMVQLESSPSILLKDLGSEVQQEKLAWSAAELNWPLQKMLANSLFNYNLRHMASRLAFMRQLGLPEPQSLWLIGSLAEPKFLERLSKRVGREVGKAEFDAFVAGWLWTEQGRRYGFKPDTVPQAQ